MRAQIERLRRAAQALDQAAESLERTRRPDWKKIIKIMEDIQMSEESKKKWTEKFFSEADLKEFAEIGKKYTPEKMEEYQKKWAELIAEVEKNLDADPALEKVQSLGDRWTALLTKGFGGHEGLQRKIGKAYQESFKTGEFPTTPSGKPPFDQKVWDFIKRVHAAGPPKKA